MEKVGKKEVGRLTLARYRQTYGEKAPITRARWIAACSAVADMLRSAHHTIEDDYVSPPVSPLSAPIKAPIKALRAHPAYVDKNRTEHEEIVTKVSELYALGEQFDAGGEA